MNGISPPPDSRGDEDIEPPCIKPILSTSGENRSSLTVSTSDIASNKPPPNKKLKTAHLRVLSNYPITVKAFCGISSLPDSLKGLFDEINGIANGIAIIPQKLVV